MCLSFFFFDEIVFHSTQKPLVCVSFLSFCFVVFVGYAIDQNYIHTKTDKHKGSLNGINSPRTMIHCNEWKVCWMHHNNAISFTHMHFCNGITVWSLSSVLLFISMCICAHIPLYNNCYYCYCCGVEAICKCSRIERKPISMLR